MISKSKLGVRRQGILISLIAVAWIRNRWPRKLLVHGVPGVADALRAVDAVVAALSLVFEGRQHDACVAPTAGDK